MQERGGAYRKEKYNVFDFGRKLFIAFDTLNQAIEYIDLNYYNGFTNYGHNHYCVTYCPNAIVQPDGFIYYRPNYLTENAINEINKLKHVPMKSDSISSVRAKFLSYVNEAPKGKYYFRDEMDVEKIYGSKNRFYVFENLDQTLNELNLTYTSEMPQEWVTEEWIEEAKSHSVGADPAFLPKLNFPLYPYKLYSQAEANSVQGLLFGRSGTLFGPNGKEVANFYARRGHGNNCGLMVGTQYPNFARFTSAVWFLPSFKTTPLGEGTPYCNAYGSTAPNELYRQPGLVGQPGFPDSINVPAMPTPCSLDGTLCDVK